MLLLYLAPLTAIILGSFSSVALLFTLFILSGLGMAGVGMGIMHDALHGSYSRHPALNKLMGYTMNLIGASDEVWKLQHNVLHHSFTNIDDHDDDINAPFFLRFCPHAESNFFHRFQHYHAWIFYGLSTLSWITVKDFIRLRRYYRAGLLRDRKEYRKYLVRIILWKVFYFSYALVLPLVMSPFSPWTVLLGFLIMHFVTGLCITVVFQAAHVVPDAAFPVPDEAGKIGNARMEHQLATTCNFSPQSKVLSWLIGGLNYQIEHHLFPHISHVHYKKISPIVKQTAAEFGISYHCYPTFFSAISGHFIMLRALSRPSIV